MVYNKQLREYQNHTIIVLSSTIVHYGIIAQLNFTLTTSIEFELNVTDAHVTRSGTFLAIITIS